MLLLPPGLGELAVLGLRGRVAGALTPHPVPCTLVPLHSESFCSRVGLHATHGAGMFSGMGTADGNLLPPVL